MAKIRCCFVSNSSSSSFIIHSSAFSSKDEYYKAIDALDKLVDTLSDNDYGEEWGENGRNYSVSGDYLFIETYYVYYEILEAFENVGINFDKLDKFHLQG